MCFVCFQGKAHRDKQLIYLKDHLDRYYQSRDRKWIVLFPEGGFLRKRRETSQAFAKKNSLPHLTHVTLPRLGATQVILRALGAQQENGSVSSESGPPSQSGNTHSHGRTHAHTQIHTHIHTHAHKYTYTRTYICTPMHAHAHTHTTMHTRTHTSSSSVSISISILFLSPTLALSPRFPTMHLVSYGGGGPLVAPASEPQHLQSLAV